MVLLQSPEGEVVDGAHGAESARTMRTALGTSSSGQKS